MNPYAADLGERDPFAVIRSSAADFHRLWENIDAQERDKPRSEDKWCAREILCHLADTEIAFAFRLRQGLSEAHHVIQPFDQTRWGERYGAYAGEAALAAFTALRRWNIVLIETAGPADLDKPLTHPERGTMTFRVVIETMAGHDLHHRRQLEECAGAGRTPR